MAKSPTPGGFTAIPNDVRAWANAQRKTRPYAWLTIDFIYRQARNSVAVVSTTRIIDALRRELGGRTAYYGTVPCRRTLCRFLDDAEAASIISRDKRQNTKDGELRMTLRKWLSAHVLQLRAAFEKKGCHRGVSQDDSSDNAGTQHPGVSQGGVTPIKDDPSSKETADVLARRRELARAARYVGGLAPSSKEIEHQTAVQQ